MAWIYLVDSEESLKPWKGTQPPSPTVKMIDTLNQYYFLACMVMTYPRRQYGTTLELYGKKCSPKESKSFTADFPAKTFQLPAAEQAWQESEADYFSRSQGSLAKYDLASSSWRTSQRLLFEEQSELLASFAASGMTLDGAFYPLRTWARITDAKDGGYWPTASARDWKDSPGMARVRPDGKSRVDQLARAVYATMWPTPTAEPFRSRGGKRKGEMGLDRMAKMWPTPRAADADKNIRTPEGRAKERLRRKNGEDLPTAVGGKLNPQWVEWLMGYPCGWTVLEDWATQWFRPRRGKPSKG